MKLLSEGARRLGLTLLPRCLKAFQTYYEELIAWNERFNLTAITDYEQVQVRHFLDSLSCLLSDESLPTSLSRQSTRVIDVGAGAGFPGLPLKIIYPQFRLTLLEATGKKTTFLDHVVGKLGLKDVTVIQTRAEELGHDVRHRERYDVALARAVAELPILAEYTLPFCHRNGILVAQKGAEAQAEVTAAQQAMAILGGRLRRIVTVELPGLAQPRSLVVIEKAALTPEKYPRRPGIPSKRPLK
jgi:16S rRNA (guanine527-N7)-methyltransferase